MTGGTCFNAADSVPDRARIEDRSSNGAGLIVVSVFLRHNDHQEPTNQPYALCDSRVVHFLV
jgi:hypothetical protein